MKKNHIVMLRFSSSLFVCKFVNSVKLFSQILRSNLDIFICWLFILLFWYLGWGGVDINPRIDGLVDGMSLSLGLFCS